MKIDGGHHGELMLPEEMSILGDLKKGGSAKAVQKRT